MQLDGFDTTCPTGTVLWQVNAEPHRFREKVERNAVCSPEAVFSIPPVLLSLVWDGKKLGKDFSMLYVCLVCDPQRGLSLAVLVTEASVSEFEY